MIDIETLAGSYNTTTWIVQDLNAVNSYMVTYPDKHFRPLSYSRSITIPVNMMSMYSALFY